MAGRAGGNAEFCPALRTPRAPAGTWHHWAAYDLPPTVAELAVGAAQNKNIKQAVNDFRKMGYGGPCPPHGHEPHHYHFRLLALSTDHLSAKTNASCPEVEREARKYAIAQATLIGWYERWYREKCRSPVREVTGFQSERFDSGFGKRPQRFDALIRGHDCCDNCFGLGRISLGHEIDRAKGCAATSRFSCYQDNLTIRHGLIYHRGSAASMSHGAP
jgi:Raf kinase inhibitor-like YbhB/YbcL family protein